jgi:hypothetical protein
MADLTELQDTLAKLKAARDKILASGEEYRMGEISGKRADLKTILSEINSVEMQIARAQGTTTTYAMFGRRL